MKKKSPRGIPDFSSKKPIGRNPFAKPAVDDKQQQRPPVIAPKIKPPSTSSKGGRRGG
jgi:hypothetical protein